MPRPLTPLRLAAMLSAALVVLVAQPRAAFAQVFSENWEGGTAAWHALDGNPIILTSDAAPACSTTFQRETILYSGGRVFTTQGIAVTGGQPYCLSAWVRGSANTAPFVGIDDSDAAGDVGAEHWLIGQAGFTNNFGGTVTPVTPDGDWHWYTATFTMDATSSFLVIKDELWNGGASGTGDFDDIALYAGACPATYPGLDQHETCSAGTPICAASSGACVECASDSDCSTATTPVCNTTTGSCSACGSDFAQNNPGPLACPSATLPACVAADGGSSAGTCVACTGENDSACATSATTPVCVTSSDVCGCTQDGQCGAGQYCDTSTTATGVCTAGCRSVDGGTTCPAGTYCSSDAGAVGQCTSEPCEPDAGCSGATPVCDTSTQPSSCVGCVVDSDCTSGSVCSAQNQCVACTPAETQNCTVAGGGTACLANGTCGCASDTDCGDGTSGYVCNGTTHACVAGCRGSGGNGCPPGATCSSTTSTPGQCVSPSDSGAGDGGGETTDSGAKDAGRSRDAGAVGSKDSGAPVADAGLDGAVGAVGATGGCNCKMHGEGPDGGSTAGLFAAALVLARRRRRRAQPPANDPAPRRAPPSP